MTNLATMWMVLALLLITVLPSQSPATCLGDCDGDGRVVASEIIRLVGIAIEEFPESTCADGLNGDRTITVDDIAAAVSAIFDECSIVSPSPTGSTTALPSPTPTDSPSATPSPSTSPTASSTPSGTATSTESPSASATTEPSPTITATPSRTLPPSPTSTPSTTATSTNTALSTATATMTLTPTGTFTPTGTPTTTPTVTPTATPFPVGEFIGGKVAYVAAGLGSVQSVVAAFVTTLTNGGSAAPLISSAGIQAPVEHRCAVSGGTTRDCTLMGTGAMHLVLGADNCVTAGLWGGTEAFNGMIALDSDPFFTNTCGPPPIFTSAAYVLQGGPDDVPPPFEILLRDSATNAKQLISAKLTGTVSLSTDVGTACLVTAVTLTLNGGLHSQIADGSQVGAVFDGATVAMDQIIFNANCVPIYYRLKFTGDVVLQAIFPGDLGSGVAATLSNFVLTQDASGNRTLSDLNGALSTGCFGTVALDPGASLSVIPGTLCALTGQFTASGSGAMATVTYEDGQVVVQQGGNTKVFSDCKAEDLQMCQPQ